MEDEKSYWKDKTLFEQKITVEITKACLQPDWDEIEHKLAHLILADIIFCNNGWHNSAWPKDHITHHVICNDVFAWGCADAEDITYSEISDLYEMWKKDPIYGESAWCIKKRKQMPQEPVERDIRAAGIWNLEELING